MPRTELRELLILAAMVFASLVVSYAVAVIAKGN
jgi:hypothetical protein